jgi:hypothetical protein
LHSLSVVTSSSSEVCRGADILPWSWWRDVMARGGSVHYYHARDKFPWRVGCHATEQSRAGQGRAGQGR